MGELDNFYSDLSSYVDQPVAKQSMRLNPIVADIGAAIGTIPEYLTGSAAKLYASLVPGYSQEERQAAGRRDDQAARSPPGRGRDAPRARPGA